MLLVASAALASAHDMFVKPARFFVEEHAEVLVHVLNGTFSKSENSITRDRVRDVSVVSPTGRAQLDTTAWSAAGDTSTFRVRTGVAGTYVIGTSTRPNVIALDAKEFNQYLAEDGIPDLLATRRRSGELDRPARERYAKHVKALIQVGAAVANQYVLYGGRTPAGARIAQRSVRSDATGLARIPLPVGETWYVKFINMTRLEGDAAADYESKWATLTFQLR